MGLFLEFAHKQYTHKPFSNAQNSSPSRKTQIKTFLLERANKKFSDSVKIVKVT